MSKGRWGIRGRRTRPVHLLRSILLPAGLESRIAPATLLHSLFPSPDAPQQSAAFGSSVAADAQHRVVGAPRYDFLQAADAGKAFVYDVPANNLVATLNNPTPDFDDRFGGAIAVAGEHVVAGAEHEDAGAFNAGIAYLYDISTNQPRPTPAVISAPAKVNSGRFGASVAASGNIAVIGAPGDGADGNFPGSVYVYDLNSVTPTLATLKLTPAATGRVEFGVATAVSGSIVVVGAPYENAGAVYVYNLLSATPTVPVAILKAPTPAIDEYFGLAVSISGKYVVVGAPNDDVGATNAGAAYVFDLTSPTPTMPAVTMLNPSPGVGDGFGGSVAIAGTMLVIGAASDGAAAPNAGTAYVYDLNSPAPNLPRAVLDNPSPAAGDAFATAVAVAGTSAFVGANQQDAGAADAGAAYIFDLSTLPAPIPYTQLQNPHSAAGDNFGSAVAVANGRLVVGADYELGADNRTGAAYVFDLQSKTPTKPVVRLANPHAGVGGGFFGNAVAIAGNVVVVGSALDSAAATQSGTVFVFDLSSASPTVPILTLLNPAPADYDQFGASVAIDGQYIVVGAFQDDAAGFDSGTAYVYDLTSKTPSLPIVTIGNPGSGVDGFGVSVAISGNLIMAGAYADDTGAADAGSAYVFDLSAPTPASPVLVINNPTPETPDLFGGAVSLSGTKAVVGARLDNTGAPNAGSAYVYDLASATPAVPIVTLNNPSPFLGASFGASVAITGDRVTVGAYGDNFGAPAAGKAYVFNLSSFQPTIPSSTIGNPTPGTNDIFGSRVAADGDLVVVAAYRDDTQNIDQGAAYVYTLAAPRVAVVTVNPGEVQRSRVTSLSVSFDQPVEFNGQPAAAFQLQRQSDGQTVGVAAAAFGNTVTLSFTGGPVEFGSLATGRYTLTINANQVFNSNGPLDGDGNGTPGGNYVLVGTPANGLFRLFGDGDGDGDVDAGDFAAFRGAFGGPSAVFDCDGDGDTDAADFAAFRGRFGSSV